MLDFLRPEARAAIWRLRDVIGAGAVILIGIWWIATFFSPVQWVGYAILALGAFLALAGIQRLRFRQNGEGPGVVKIVERRLAYFGPLTGGVIDMDDALKLELEPAAHPAPHWVLTSQTGDIVEIPVNAEGADDLFDLFASLPNIETGKMLELLENSPEQRVVIWSKSRPLLH